MDLETLRYPIGRFEPERDISAERRLDLMDQIARAPARLRDAVEDLTEDQLDTPYRPDGWSVRQVVHHVPDSHMNGYIRFKWALTESDPEIKVYDEAGWARTPEVAATPITVSLSLLDALHERWDVLLRAMSADDFARTLRHPEMGAMSLDIYLQVYAWHGRHHVAHVTALRESKGW